MPPREVPSIATTRNADPVTIQVCGRLSVLINRSRAVRPTGTGCREMSVGGSDGDLLGGAPADSAPIEPDAGPGVCDQWQIDRRCGSDARPDHRAAAGR